MDLACLYVAMAVMVAALLYPFFLYPILLRLIPARFQAQRPGHKAQTSPSTRLSIVVPAFNSLAHVAAKIDNCLALDYPEELLQIIVVSDHSDDGTDEIVKAYSERHGHVVYLRTPGRFGKEKALDYGLEQVTGDVVLLTDCNTFVQPNAAQVIMERFADEQVGVVSCFDQLDTEGADGKALEGGYVGTEMKLRAAESRHGSLISASGCCFAVRAELCKDKLYILPCDFHLPLRALGRGYACVQEDRLVARYKASPGVGAEFNRKIRTCVHGFFTVHHHRELLNPLRYPLISWMIFSHKIAKWLLPSYLITLAVLVVWAGLLGNTLFAVLTYVGVVGLAIALLGAIPALRRGPLAHGWSLLTTMLAPYFALVRFAKNDPMAVWSPTAR